MNYINIGSSPPEEDCFQTPDPRGRQECEIFRDQLKRQFPAGKFVVKAFSHDFGTYHEVVARLGEGEEADEAAYTAEAEGPEYWDPEALPLIFSLREQAS